MLGHWLLVLVLLPGWLLPSGARVPLCGCLFGPIDGRSCCVVETAPPCCTAAHADAAGKHADGREDTAERECNCSVAVPERADPLARPDSAPVAVDGVCLWPQELPAWGTSSSPRPALAAPRPRGPSPGGVIPLPLRL
ncbi:MAG: hypothetical protein JNK02_01225 [Planctomycetes bacterium]|nr:hypothetical protein [Planctomycetota bacterium]